MLLAKQFSRLCRIYLTINISFGILPYSREKADIQGPNLQNITSRTFEKF